MAKSLSIPGYPKGNPNGPGRKGSKEVKWNLGKVHLPKK